MLLPLNTGRIHKPNEMHRQRSKTHTHTHTPHTCQVDRNTVRRTNRKIVCEMVKRIGIQIKCEIIISVPHKSQKQTLYWSAPHTRFEIATTTTKKHRRRTSFPDLQTMTIFELSPSVDWFYGYYGNLDVWISVSVARVLYLNINSNCNCMWFNNQFCG